MFFQGQTLFGHISGMVGPIDVKVKRKGSASVGFWVQYVTLTFDLTHDPDLVCFKVKFRNSSFLGIVGLIAVKWKRIELIWYWADCMTLAFDHTHMTLTLELVFHYLPYFSRLSSYHASWYNIQRIVMCNMVSSHVISHGAQLEVPPLWEDQCMDPFMRGLSPISWP